MALSSGNKVAASDYNELFTTLEAIRKKHAARKGLTSTQQTKLKDTTLGGYKTTLAAGNVADNANVTKVKNAVNFLATFAPDLSSFKSTVTVPDAGALLKVTELSSLNSTITKQNSACANCSFNSSHDSSHCSFDSSFNSFGSFNSSWDGTFC